MFIFFIVTCPYIQIHPVHFICENCKQLISFLSQYLTHKFLKMLVEQFLFYLDCMYEEAVKTKVCKKSIKFLLFLTSVHSSCFFYPMPCYHSINKGMIWASVPHYNVRVEGIDYIQRTGHCPGSFQNYQNGKLLDIGREESVFGRVSDSDPHSFGLMDPDPGGQI